MDIELLRTFLEVNRTRHFGRAADNLYLTQSAVSARIRQLEDALGTPLFTRQRNDIHLTPAGKRLLHYAENIVSTWQRARMDANLEEEFSTSLTVGGLFDLWDGMLLDWLVRVRSGAPDIAVHSAAYSASHLYRELLNGVLDLIFLFEVPVSSEIKSKFIRSMNLVLVSQSAGQTVSEALADNFIMVDWGTAQAIGHARLFPDAPSPAVHMSHGGMALSFLLMEGGCAYLPEEWVAGHLETGRLHLVKKAPVVEREIHAIWRMDSEREQVVRRAIEYL